MAVTKLLVVAGLALAASAGSRASAAGGEKPLPVEATTICPGGGTVFYVEGHKRIPKGVSIKVQKDTKIVGRGGDAVIEVEGELAITGVHDSRVTIEDVTIEVQPKFQNVHLDEVVMKGLGGVRSPTDGRPVDGRLFIDATSFSDATSVEVTAIANEYDLQHVSIVMPVKFKAVDPPGTGGVNHVKLNVRDCSGINGGLAVEHLAEVIVRTNVLAGAKVSFVDCDDVTFDANYVTAKSLEFIEKEGGHFGKIKMQKCDVQCDTILLKAPVVPNKPETFVVDKCWFNGETSPKKVKDKFFKDHDKDAESGVTADLQKIMEKPLQLAGTVKR